MWSINKRIIDKISSRYTLIKTYNVKKIQVINLEYGDGLTVIVS